MCSDQIKKLPTIQLRHSECSGMIIIVTIIKVEHKKSSYVNEMFVFLVCGHSGAKYRNEYKQCIKWKIKIMYFGE